MASSEFIVSAPFTVTFIHFKAAQLCRRSDFSRSDREDLEQSMRLYLLEKAHLFDPTRGNLEAFVTQALKTWVAMELRFRKRGKRSQSYRAVSLEGTPVNCDGDVTSLGEVLLEEDGNRRTQVDSISSLEQFEMRDAIDHAQSKLSPEDQDLLKSIVAHGITATAKARGISWRQVSNAMDRIRQEFESAGFGNP